MTFPFAPIQPGMGAEVVYADPPWKFSAGTKGRSQLSPRMTRLVFLHHLRFEKGRRRCFTVSVWRRVKGLSARPASMWGAELAEAWRGGRDATA